MILIVMLVLGERAINNENAVKLENTKEENLVDYFNQNINLKPNETIEYHIKADRYSLYGKKIEGIENYYLTFNKDNTFDEEFKTTSNKIIFNSGKYKIKNDILTLFYLNSNKVHDILILDVKEQEVQLKRFSQTIKLVTSEYDNMEFIKNWKFLLAVFLFAIIATIFRINYLRN